MWHLRVHLQKLPSSLVQGLTAVDTDLVTGKALIRFDSCQSVKCFLGGFMFFFMIFIKDSFLAPHSEIFLLLLKIYFTFHGCV